MEEKFKRIYLKSVKTKYLISNYGTVVSEFGNIPKELKLVIDDDGYYRIKLYVNKKQYAFRVNRLVAIAFIPIPDKYLNSGYTMDTLVVNHKDGNKKNNFVDNLEWCTNKENILHAEINHLRHHLSGANHPATQIDESLVRLICEEAVKNELSIKEIGLKYKVPFHKVYSIIHKLSWTSVSDDYDMSGYNVREPRYNNCHLSKLSESDVIHICEELEKGGATMKELAKKYNVSDYAIQRIKYHDCWNQISKNYNF